MESIHSGHRERLRKRFLENGLDSFSDIEAIEMLLFFALPRRNTNPLSHALLSSFGSYRAVFEAQITDLMKVEGIGENAACLIRLVSELGRRYMISGRKQGKIIRSTADAGEYFLPLFSFASNEQVYVACLDSSGRVKQCKRIASGMENQVEFTPRDIISVVMQYDASHVILAHNHLSGTALPSAADIAATNTLKNALNIIKVELDDHIIVCDGDFVSLKDSGHIH